MHQDEYLILWAQWGILNFERCDLLLKYFGSFEVAWKKIRPEFLKNLGMGDEKIERVFKIRGRLSFQATYDQIKKFNIKLYSWQDEDYPFFLKQLKTPPPFIFVRGKLPSFHKSISIVGTRNISNYGRLLTEKFTSDLVQEGFVIVSGLALGVDSIAHQTTVKNQGITVAVLGSGVDQIYPTSNHQLAKNIVESGGAIISAYPLGAPPLPHHFPERNEIVAGLTKGTLVIEGGIKSGALITAKMALEQGRDVFAVPTNVSNHVPSGTNHLIRKSEAKLVENVSHILDDFSLESNLQIPVQEFDVDERVLLKILSAGPKTMDQLFEESGFDVPRLSELLIHLTLKSAAAQQGERWMII